MNLDLNIEENHQTSPIARLFQLGREQSYLTYDDILRFVPEPEKDLDQLDRIFAALICAGIPFGDDIDHLEGTEEEIIKEMEIEEG
jgi:hypothetical protein